MALEREQDDLILTGESDRIVVVSDFHMGEGYSSEKRVYSRFENFFQDDAFQAFLRYLHKTASKKGARTTLVINGDFLDFLRVRSLPVEREKRILLRYLRRIGKEMADADSIVNAEELAYGLGSDELKSAWKLRRISEGHQGVFAAMSEFIVNGNRIIIVKGNHDLEFYWPRVQRELRKILASQIPSFNGRYQTATERLALIEESVHFCQRAVRIDETIYIEHGHQYEPITRLAGPAERDGELAMPAGSLFNRYLINSIENISPIIANIRPVSDVLKTMSMRQKFGLLRVLFRNLPVASRMVLRHYQGYGIVLLLEALPNLILLLYAAFGLILPTIWNQYAEWYTAITGAPGKFLVENWFLNVVLAGAGYVALKKLFRILGRNHEFHIDKAIAAAKRRLGQGSNQRERFIVYSHTHRPENHNMGDGWWYINTGTWIPIIERKEILMHEKLTLSYAAFEKDDAGKWDFQLMRWDDARGRGERLVLLEH